MTLTTHTECCQDWQNQLTIDAEQRLVRNVALTSQHSKNGYQYTTEALQAAAPLYDSKPVFLDHAPDRLRPQERSTRDLVGSIINPRFEQGRIRGDIRVVETASGETFLKLLDLNTPGVGMSHVVRARRSSEKNMVEEIVEVISVDVVVNPATTSTFRESIDTAATDRSETPGLSSPGVSPAATHELLAEQYERVLAERDQLAQHNQQLQSELQTVRNRQAVQLLLRESRLPDRAVSDLFVQQLEATRDEQQRRQMIQDRMTLLTPTPDALRPQVSSTPRELLSESARLDDLFIQAIHRP